MRRGRQASDWDGRAQGQPQGPPRPPLSREQRSGPARHFPAARGWPHFDLPSPHALFTLGRRLPEAIPGQFSTFEVPGKPCQELLWCGAAAGAGSLVPLSQGARTGTSRHQRERWHRGMSKPSARLCPGPEAFSRPPSRWWSHNWELSKGLQTCLGGSLWVFQGPALPLCTRGRALITQSQSRGRSRLPDPPGCAAFGNIPPPFWSPMSSSVKWEGGISPEVTSWQPALGHFRPMDAFWVAHVQVTRRKFVVSYFQL